MISLQNIRHLVDPVKLHNHLQQEHGGDVRAFLKSLDDGLNNLIRSDLKKAEEFVKYTDLIAKNLDRKYQARLISLQARCALWAGKYASAERQYSRALKLFTRYRNFEDAARVRKVLVDVQMYRGRYREAIDTGQRAVRYFRKKGMQNEAGQTLTNIGNVYHRMDRNLEAMRYYDKARRIFQKDGGMALAIVDFNRANIFANLNQLSQARELYSQSANYYRRAGLEIARCQAEYSIAYLMFLEEEYTEALNQFEKVRDDFTELGDLKTAAIASLDLVELYVRLNQYGSAIMLGEELIPQLKELGMEYEEAKTCYFVALAKLELDDLSQARVSLNRARRLFQSEKNDLWLGMVQLARTGMLQARRQYRQAVKSAVTAERHFDRAQDYRRKSDALLAKLDGLYGSGETHKAKRLAHSIGLRKLMGHQQYRLHETNGDHFFNRGEYALALVHYREAVKVVEKMLSGLYQDEIRLFFAADKYRSYARMVECMVSLGRADEALLSNLAALSLINRTSVPKSKLRAELPKLLQENIVSLRAALNKLQRYPGKSERGAAGVATHLTAEEELWQYQRKARRILYRRDPHSRQTDTNLQDCLKRLDRDETLVNFFQSRQSAGAFVSSVSGTLFVPFEHTPEQLRVMIRKLSFVLERSVSNIDSDSSRRIDHYLQSLHDAIITPLEPHLIGNRLIIIADNFYRQIPFNALCDRNRVYLKDRFRVELISRPEDLLRESEPGLRFASTRNAVFGVPSESLPLVDEEVKRVRGQFARARLYLGDRARCGTLVDELTRADGFIHIATHASRSSENPLFSRILMADGPFFPFDLFGNGIKARLVTLSGCQTAAPGLYYGNSLSLAGAFCHAGTHLAVAALWSVLDETSLQFMTEFYARLKKTNDVAASYRQAVNALEKLTDNPALWGSFVLLGR